MQESSAKFTQILVFYMGDFLEIQYEKWRKIMARTSKKSVYERIEEKLQDIKNTEALLALQNEELQTLYLEKDDLEMRQLLEMMKSKGLTIDEAAKLFQDDFVEGKESKKKTKKENVEENN